MAKQPNDYGADQIQVLEGLDPVRKRPGMYIGSTGPSGLHHCVWEVVDNAVDEAMAGHATRIDVTLLADGGCRVADDGRGIPVEPQKSGPQKGKSTLEVVMTVLHAGGKFGGGGYKVSGGLHGVGVSVVNALSSRLVAEVHRDGSLWRQEFAAVKSGGTVRCGVSQGKLKKVGKSPKAINRKGPFTGTTVTFWPDPDVFETVEFRASTITERLQVMAYLNRGLEIGFRDERPGHEQEVTFRYDGGIVDYVAHLNSSKQPLFTEVGYLAAQSSEGEVEVAWQWNSGFHEALHSFANGISTTEGGTHAEGFRKALTQAVNRYARDKGLLKERDGNLLGEDVREGMTAIVSVRLEDPQFEGQTKSKLGSTQIRGLVERATGERFSRWLEEHPTEAKAIVGKAQQAAKARTAAKKARDLTRKRSKLDGAGLSGKLADCTAKKGRELWIVEGGSAGGSAKEARDPATQAILPLKGKILNVERAGLDKVLANAEVQSIVAAVGGGIGRDFDLSKVRYDAGVVIAADADSDGGHISVLLLTLFWRHMRPLIEAGMVYVAEPPLFSTVIDNQKVYVANEAEKAELEARYPRKNLVFVRFKGLGEMDPSELRETTMDPATRRLSRITVEQAALADDLLSTLMGDDAETRRQYIQANANDVQFLDI